MKQKVLSILALLLMAATGAWAQTEELLTTITATGKDTYSETTAGVVTVSHDNDYFDNTFGWLWYEHAGSVTVEAKDGYTITKCVFRQPYKTPFTVSTAPFKVDFIETSDPDMPEFKQYLCQGYMDGVSSIEVYGYAPSAATGYSVTLKDDTEDADNWKAKVGNGELQALPLTGLTGDGTETVTITYNGTKRVKSVTAVKKAAAPGTDLATITANYEAKDGDILTGTLGSNVKISIADGATVTLKDVTINGVDNPDYGWAGITCAGDATITLEGANTVKGFQARYPGIYVPEGKTLTIDGTGSLNASSNGRATGIGGGWYKHCGDIVINGGNITATGGNYNAGIGGGEGEANNRYRCGKITINGGTVNATGGNSAAGIGCGNYGASNDITITGGTVTATGGGYAAGIGSGEGGSCGAITISGGTVTATGGTYGAGIGGGNKNGASGTITITSGVTQVTATKGSDCLNSIGNGDGGTAITVVIEDYDKVIQN